MNFKVLITSIFVLTTLNASDRSDTTAGGGASAGDGGSTTVTGFVVVNSDRGAACMTFAHEVCEQGRLLSEKLFRVSATLPAVCESSLSQFLGWRGKHSVEPVNVLDEFRLISEDFRVLKGRQQLVLSSQRMKFLAESNHESRRDMLLNWCVSTLFQIASTLYENIGDFIDLDQSIKRRWYKWSVDVHSLTFRKGDELVDATFIAAKEEIESILRSPSFNATSFFSVLNQVILGLERGSPVFLMLLPKVGEIISVNHEKFMEELAGNENRNTFAATFLSFMFCQEQQALAHVGHSFCKFPESVDQEKIRAEIQRLFSRGVLNRLSQYYDSTPICVLPQEVPAKREIRAEKNTCQSPLLGGYQVNYTQSLVPGNAVRNILIDFYGGNCKGDPEKNNPIVPLHESMMVVSPLLGDYDFEVFQADQLIEAHFATTHAVLLKRMSDFVAYLRAEHPGAKIHLYGSSFGGFFGMSYAYLQSGGRHNPWAEAGIQGAFGTERISPIDGIICHAAALHCMQKIMAEGSDLSCITVPACLHFNDDDERVKLEEQRPFVEQLGSPNVVVSPFGAESFMGELDEAEFLLLNLRGHLNNAFSKREFDEQVLRFLGHM